ncbi:MAG: hypothetical protein IKN26_00705, partial [Eubacterium sp.]|nr:hypothetical protein [Eubacterium sp.]
MKKYNYFDDDEKDINSLISSFDAPKEVKKEEIDKTLQSISEEREAVRKAELAEQRKQRKQAFAQSVRDLSKKSGKAIVFAARSVARAVKDKKVSETLESLSKSKKRKVTISLVFVFFLSLVIMVCATVHSVNNENRRIAKFNNDAGKICSQYITKYGNCSYENLYTMYKITGYRMNGLCFVREVDFDNDGVSELLLCYNDGGVYYTEVWGYKDNQFANFYHGEAAQTNKKSDAWITIYNKNNKYYIGVHSGDKLEKVALYALKGDVFEKKYNAQYDEGAQAYSIKKKVDPISFERIKLAILVEEKAAVTTEQVSKTIDSFLGTGGTAKLLNSNQNLQSAYYAVVEDRNQAYGKAKVVKKNGVSYISGLAAVDLVDFNGDDKAELVLIYRKSVKVRSADSQGNYIAGVDDKYYIEIYRYNGAKAVLAYTNENISNSLNDSTDLYYIIKKKNNKAYYCVNAFSTQEYGRVVNASSTVFKFDGTQFVSQNKAQYRTSYGYTDYFINDQEVYKSAFNEKGYAFPLFDGGSKYDENTYTVTYLQRKQ